MMNLRLMNLRRLYYAICFGVVLFATVATFQMQAPLTVLPKIVFPEEFDPILKPISQANHHTKDLPASDSENQFPTKEQLLQEFHDKEPSIVTRKQLSALEIAHRYGIPQTPNPLCFPNTTTTIGWIPCTQCKSGAENIAIIPKFIFQSWKSNVVEEPICHNVLKWSMLNPEYDYFLFDDKAVARFFEVEYESAIPKAYSCVRTGAAKCDVWRLFIIYVFGGIYFDLDAYPTVPFLKWGFGNRTVISGRGCNNKRHPGGCGHQWGLIYSPQHYVMREAIFETLGNLALREATHVYDVSFHAFYHAWRNGPYNQSYMPGWEDHMGGRVRFFDPAAKEAMIRDAGHWPKNTGATIWQPGCYKEGK
jgi:hypothetical protein